jgi:hypothetical protein
MVISRAMVGGISFFWGDCAVVAFCPWAMEENTSAAASATPVIRFSRPKEWLWNFIG